MSQQRAAGRHAGKHLINVLWLNLAGDFADHRRLIGIARAKPYRECVINQRGVLAHIRDGAVHIRIVFRQHAHQNMTFSRLVNRTGIRF
ncbi:hypothetical protein D3C86_1801330 [compost metagenome]